jgi:hypothetical protein
VSLPIEWSWHLLPLRGSKERYFSIGFPQEIKESSGNFKYGLHRDQDWDSVHLQIFSAKTIFE